MSLWKWLRTFMEIDKYRAGFRQGFKMACRLNRNYMKRQLSKVEKEYKQ